MVDRPRYSRDQLAQFFDRIALPEPKRLYSVAALGEASALEHLNLLVKHTLVRVPFENLTLHYSWHRTVNVRPQHLFNKMVAGTQQQPSRKSASRRGGYCMENNSLFHTVLLSLGFCVFMAGARVRDQAAGRYGGFSHCVNVVVLGAQRYVVDVGFGASGPARALPLVAGAEHVHLEGGAPGLVRLVREPIAQQVDQSQRVWIYQHRAGAAEEQEWTPMYCFVDVEFLLEDIRGLNLSPWKSATSWFTQKVVLTRFTTSRETAEEPGAAAEEAVAEGVLDGALILFEDRLKWRRGRKTVFETTLRDEAERVEAIRRYFGIELDEEDQQAIRGTVSEIKHQAPIIS
ncbi:cysteine proteinase [Hypoxylon sp. FL1284]|nr:cysteine proteinase [Hypoxylon sp. FL1284]